MAHVVLVLVLKIDYLVEDVVVEAECTIVELFGVDFVLGYVGYDGYVGYIAGYIFESLTFAKLVKENHVVGLVKQFGVGHDFIVLADSLLGCSEDDETVVELGDVRL